MTLPYREERLLRRVEHALRRSDPDLAARLSIFARLNAAGAMPARERLRPQPRCAARVWLWPVAAVAFLVAALAFLVVFAAGGGLTAARACGAAPVHWVREHRDFKGFSLERTLVSPFKSLRVRIPARPGER